jgi:4-amino-4-deoxy-L-arabinose transferase-like glycosyltransferase
MGETKKTALAIFVLACAIRLLAVWFWSDDNVGNADQTEYLALAQNIKLHAVFSYGAPHTWGAPGLLNSDGPFLPTAARPPLFPLLVASLWWGESPPLLQVRIVQSIMGGLVAVLAYLMTLTIFGRRPALFAGFGMALAPMSIAMTLAILTETLFTFLLTLAMWLWSRNHALAAGVLLGLATLARAILLPILAAIALLAIVLKFNRATHVKILLGAVLVIAPWAARNAITQQAFVPVASMGWGANVFLGTFDFPYNAGNFWFIANEDKEFHKIVHESPSETLAERQLMTAALERIAADPLAWVIVRIKQYPRLFLSSGYYLSPIIPLPKQVLRIVYAGGGVLFLLLTAWGLYLARAQWRQTYPAMLVVFIFCASQFPGVGEERYSAEIAPLLMIFTGLAMARLTSWSTGSKATTRSASG